MVKRIFLNSIVRKINALIFHLTRYDLTKMVFLRFLRGFTREDLLNAATIFYDEYLYARKIDDALDVINKYKEKGYEFCLISATIDVLAEVIGKKLHANSVHSTTLIYDSKGVCSGKLEFDLLGKKLDYSKKQQLYPFSIVLADDFSDLPLIRNAKIAYIITYQKNLNRWKSKIDTNMNFIIK